MREILEPTEAMDLIDELGICGCGCPGMVYETIHEMMKDFKAKKWDIDYDDVSPYKLYMVYSLNHLGLLEHGTSVRCSWLTTKGEKLLDALEHLKQYEYDIDLDKLTDDEYFYQVGKEE